MSRIGSKNTTPEIKVRKFLFSNGFRYRLHNKELPGSPDISNKSRKIAIFVNGCFWHRHGCDKTSNPKSNVDFWEKKFNENIERDNKAYKQLKTEGWSVIIIWECEIFSRGFERKFSDIL